jgi:hypothetical protein
MKDVKQQCRLCKENIADKKGSHIVPHFLLKRIENIDGKSERDYELGFVIQEFDTKSHFGRSVPIEKLDNVYGELSDEEIQKNKHPLIVDYVFCKKCEDSLAKIESEYAQTLKKSNDKTYSSGISSELGFLFWASVIWRISINNQSGVKLSKGQDEILRRILARTLQAEIKDIDFKALRESNDANKISYKLIRCSGFSEKEATHMVFHPLFRYPYSIIIDEFLLFFSFNNNYNDYLNKDFFGIKKEVFEAPLNCFNGEEQIYPISHQRMLDVNKSLIEHIKDLRVKKLNLFWDRLHIALGGRGRTMPEYIKKEIFEELTSEEKRLGRKHNLEDLRNSTFKVMKKYAP